MEFQVYEFLEVNKFTFYFGILMWVKIDMVIAIYQ